MKVRDDGQLMIHDIVREFSEAELHARAPQRWRDIHTMAMDYYKKQLSLQPLYTSEWLKHLLELLYHAVAVNEAEAVLIFVAKCTDLLEHTYMSTVAP